jgi:hypothetical protein
LSHKRQVVRAYRGIFSTPTLKPDPMG